MVTSTNKSIIHTVLKKQVPRLLVKIHTMKKSTKIKCSNRRQLHNQSQRINNHNTLVRTELVKLMVTTLRLNNPEQPTTTGLSMDTTQVLLEQTELQMATKTTLQTQTQLPMALMVTYQTHINQKHRQSMMATTVSMSQTSKIKHPTLVLLLRKKTGEIQV
ncbi:hypothetical protein D499_0E01810 [Hanseniaspora uvarum DSM 2768]|nr:hypothetical protein D499_0E01810 [Hanseniaspora uvarum DSM 2768]